MMWVRTPPTRRWSFHYSSNLHNDQTRKCWHSQSKSDKWNTDFKWQCSQVCPEFKHLGSDQLSLSGNQTLVIAKYWSWYRCSKVPWNGLCVFTYQHSYYIESLLEAALRTKVLKHSKERLDFVSQEWAVYFRSCLCTCSRLGWIGQNRV